MNNRTRVTDGVVRFVSFDELQKHTGLGRSSALQIAKDAKAIVKYGRRVVYDLNRVDAFMETLAG